MKGVRIIVRGRVQGVGFRAWTVGTAQALGIVGWVRNRRDGSVEILAAGNAEALDQLVTACRHGPHAAEVAGLEMALAEPPARKDFLAIETR